MVKPKAPAGQAQQMKTATQANRRPATMSINSPVVAHPRKAKLPSVSTCTGCGIVIVEEVKAVAAKGKIGVAQIA